MMVELLPCPFCGTPNPERVYYAWNDFRIECNNGCGYACVIAKGEVEAEAAWNSRPGEDDEAI